MGTAIHFGSRSVTVPTRLPVLIFVLVGLFVGAVFLAVIRRVVMRCSSQSLIESSENSSRFIHDTTKVGLHPTNTNVLTIRALSRFGIVLLALTLTVVLPQSAEATTRAPDSTNGLAWQIGSGWWGIEEHVFLRYAYSGDQIKSEVQSIQTIVFLGLVHFYSPLRIYQLIFVLVGLFLGAVCLAILPRMTSSWSRKTMLSTPDSTNDET